MRLISERQKKQCNDSTLIFKSRKKSSLAYLYCEITLYLCVIVYETIRRKALTDRMKAAHKNREDALHLRENMIKTSELAKQRLNHGLRQNQIIKEIYHK